ncbi:MAG: ParB/RepB/Spo0J family partition protein [Oscillospiraceae bacterium]|nr:ParB/RepB/Spo0J family partition protein [Oscillospiraceae bacterium]
MQKYICKCGRTFSKSSAAATTGYPLKKYEKGHECYGCPFIVVERDWQTNEIIKYECRATPQITYSTRCYIGINDGDHTSCHLYTLDLNFAKCVMDYIKTLDGAANTQESWSYNEPNSLPKEWRAADFGKCYAFNDCFGLAILPLSFQSNKKGTEARRAVMERFFTSDGKRKDILSEYEEKETVLSGIKAAIAAANDKMEEINNMRVFNIEAFTSQGEQLKQIALDLLIPYHNHKFKLYEGERLDDMVNSIKDNGVLTPIIVRPAPDNEGKYEILAGHNRCNAAKKAGLTTVPGIVKENLSDEEAEMYVIETNLMQRGFNDLSISEQAAVIAMRHSQMFNEDKRAAINRELRAMENSQTENDNSEQPEKQSKLAAAGEEYGLSKNTVARLIRINKLLTLYDKFTLAVDLKDLSVRAAVELSYITSKTALELIFDKYSVGVVVDNVWHDSVKINMAKAVELRSIFENFRGSKEQAVKLLNEGKPSIADEDETVRNVKPIKISMQPDMFQRYFKPETKPDEIAETIEKALDMYFSQQNQNESSTDDNDDGIEKFEFTEHTYKALKTQRINTVSELKAFIEDEDTARNILGIKAVDEILITLDLEEDI